MLLSSDIFAGRVYAGRSLRVGIKLGKLVGMVIYEDEWT